MKRSESILPVRPGQRGAERLRRRMYLAVAIFACVEQIAVSLITVSRGGGLQGTSVCGVLICAVLIMLLTRTSVSVQHTTYLVLPLGTLLVGAQLYTAFQRHAMTPELYIIEIAMFIAAFGVLPFRWAALYVILLYLVFVALNLHAHGDLTLLVEMGLVVLLTAKLTVFGQGISVERAEAGTLHTLASVDPLTQLLNRRAMYPYLESVFDKAPEERQAAVLLLDVDHFKRVNDTHGHAVGDEVLQRFAHLLQGEVRPRDSLCRWGGEEFLILLQGTCPAVAGEIAERLLQKIREADMPAGLRLTASCGVAHASRAVTVAEWLVHVDDRLCVAKQDGRDRVCADA